MAKQNELVRIADMNVDRALAVLGNRSLGDLTPVEQLWMEEAEGDQDAYVFQPSRLTVAPGGGRSFVLRDGTMVPAPLKAMPILAVRTRGYWPEKVGGNKMPFCSSTGAVLGQVNPAYTDRDLAAAATARPGMIHPALRDIDEGGDIQVAYSCALCPLSKFGSAHQGDSNERGQACKEKVTLLAMIDGWHMPVILTIPTMSVMAWNNYCSGIKLQTGKPFYSHAALIDLERKENDGGQPYSSLKFERGALLEDAERVAAVIVLQRAFKEQIKGRNLAVELYDEDEMAYADDGDVVEVR